MKICLINSKFPPILGGGETYTFQLAYGLTLRGHEVVVITGKHSERKVKKYNFKVVEIEGFADTNLELSKCIPQLYDAVLSLKPDIVHVHNYLPFFVYQQISSAFPNSRVVFSVHNTPNFPERVFGCFGHFASEFAFAQKLLDNGNQSVIVSGSYYFARSISQISSLPQRIEVLPYCVDKNIFKPVSGLKLRKKLHISDKNILILSPARIIARKGQIEIIRALSLLPENYVAFFPAAANPDDKKVFDELRLETRKLKVVKRVFFGNEYYPDDLLSEIYSAADVAVLPSYHEGFGIALLEAMACKCPVIGSNIPGVDEVITNGVTGLLIKPRDHVALASSILKLMSDHELKNNLVEAAYLRTSTTFGLDKHIDKLEKLYETIL